MEVLICNIMLFRILLDFVAYFYSTNLFFASLHSYLLRL